MKQLDLYESKDAQEAINLGVSLGMTVKYAALIASQQKWVAIYDALSELLKQYKSSCGLCLCSRLVTCEGCILKDEKRTVAQACCPEWRKAEESMFQAWNDARRMLFRLNILVEKGQKSGTRKCNRD